MRFVITCGGTAGHINPGLAVADKLKSLLPDSEFLFIGASGHMEEDLIPRSGYALETIKVSNLSRSISLSGLAHNIRSGINLFNSHKDAKNILKKFNPDFCIGTGGYVCYPVLKAAGELEIKTLVHESNAVPGLTTKMLADKVNYICVGFEDSRQYYNHSDRVYVTGTPVRGEFLELSRECARETLGVSKNDTLVVSLWGSLGARDMNNIICDIIPKIISESDLHFVHSTGKNYYAQVMDKLLSISPEILQNDRISISDYIYNSPLWMYAADLILCRAGASTLAELCYSGTPAIIVPSPNVTNNHQEKNARVLEAAGGAKVFLETKFSSDEFYSEVYNLASNKDKLKEMSAAIKSLSVDNASDIICDLIIKEIRK